MTGIILARPRTTTAAPFISALTACSTPTLATTYKRSPDQDGNTYRVSQTLTDLLGKQLRIDVSNFNSGVATRDDVTVGHLIPADNPFVGTATGINQLIYALGLRNPFTFAVQPTTGRILVNDVGENTWEEIDDSVAGGNYGWSGGNTDGFGNPPPSFAAGTYHDPLLAYAHSGTASLATGVAIVGGTFYNPPTVQFPHSYVGMYFYEDLGSGWIRYFNPNTPNSASTPDGNSVAFASNTPGGLRDLKVDSAGNLYYLSGGDGSIRRISFTASQVEATLFYAGSPRYDTTGNPQTPLPFSDDNAIATDKTAYLPGSGAATFANVSSYTAGINGIMVDISGTHGTLTANDFIFKVGNNNSPNAWTTVCRRGHRHDASRRRRGRLGPRRDHVAQQLDPERVARSDRQGRRHAGRLGHEHGPGREQRLLLRQRRGRRRQHAGRRDDVPHRQ